MKSDEWLGILIILGIIFIGLTGGFHIASQRGYFSETTQTQQSTQNQVVRLSSALSPYHGIISLSYPAQSNDPNQEYISIRNTNYGSAAKPILVTGWKIQDANGTVVTIPKASYLYFTNSENTADPVYLSPNDTLYLITGTSPINASFKLNKCSGYLDQFNTFIPYVPQDCPLARNEDLSKIPTYATNDACFDYINSYPACKTQTDILPNSWSVECRNFITNLNYQSCVDTHKKDSDFYENSWRVYLNRSDHIWKSSHEDIILYDNNGKVVDEVKY